MKPSHAVPDDTHHGVHMMFACWPEQAGRKITGRRFDQFLEPVHCLRLAEKACVSYTMVECSIMENRLGCSLLQTPLVCLHP